MSRVFFSKIEQFLTQMLFWSAPSPGDNKGTWENKVLKPAWKHMDRFGGKIGEPQKAKETESNFYDVAFTSLNASCRSEPQS